MNPSRRAFIVAATAYSLAAMAQQPQKIYRIGYLSTGPRIEPRDEAFRNRLGELGFVDGKNAIIGWRFTQGKSERSPGFAAELWRANVDCIVGVGVSSVRDAKRATDRVPIVIATIDADPVELGLIASLARPGGNVTGFTGIAYELAGKRLELLKEIVPKATRVGMLLPDVDGPASLAHYRGTQVAARNLGMEVQLIAPRSPEELEGLFSGLREKRPDVLSVFTGAWFNSHRTRIVELAATLKLPAVYSNDMFVPIGGLVHYSADLVHQFRETAMYVAKILSGTKPSDLPVQQPTKFELAVNLKTAKALGIAVPQTIMLRADRIVR